MNSKQLFFFKFENEFSPFIMHRSNALCAVSCDNSSGERFMLDFVISNWSRARYWLANRLLGSLFFIIRKCIKSFNKIVATWPDWRNGRTRRRNRDTWLPMKFLWRYSRRYKATHLDLMRFWEVSPLVIIPYLFFPSSSSFSLRRATLEIAQSCSKKWLITSRGIFSS